MHIMYSSLHYKKVEALKDLNENELKTKISTDLETATIDNIFQITKNIFQAFQKSNLISLEISQGTLTYLSFLKDKEEKSYLSIVDNDFIFHRIYEEVFDENKNVIIEKILKIKKIRNEDVYK